MLRPLPRRIAGFSLIEVLIALVILAVGLLGIAAMVSESLKSKDSSYYHTQALNLANAMLDRMRANRDAATSNGYDTQNSTGGGFGGTTFLSPPAGYCKDTAAHSTAELAACDVGEWQHEIAVLLPAFPSGAPAMGSISTSSISQMTQVQIAIEWNDQRANQAVQTTDSASTSTAPAAVTKGVVFITSGL